MNEQEKTDQQIIYAFARCEQWLDDFAKSTQLPPHVVAARVADLLLRQTSGQVLGSVDSLPALRGHRATRNQTTRKMALARGSHRKAQVRRRKDFGTTKDTARVNRIKRMVASGRSTKYIADKLGITSSGVYYYAKAHDIQLNLTRKGPHAVNG